MLASIYNGVQKKSRKAFQNTFSVYVMFHGSGTGRIDKRVHFPIINNLKECKERKEGSRMPHEWQWLNTSDQLQKSTFLMSVIPSLLWTLEYSWTSHNIESRSSISAFNIVGAIILTWLDARHLPSKQQSLCMRLGMFCFHQCGNCFMVHCTTKVFSH